MGLVKNLSRVTLDTDIRQVRLILSDVDFDINKHHLSHRLRDELSDLIIEYDGLPQKDKEWCTENYMRIYWLQHDRSRLLASDTYTDKEKVAIKELFTKIPLPDKMDVYLESVKNMDRDLPVSVDEKIRNYVEKNRQSPRKKGEPYPLYAMQKDIECSLQRYLGGIVWLMNEYPKDYVLVDNEPMSIKDYNEKYGRKLSLDEVYGAGYTDTLTPEDIFKCESDIPHRYGVQPGIPDYPGTSVALAFAEAMSRGTIDRLADFLAEDVCLTFFRGERKIIRMRGNKRVCGYFSRYAKRISNMNSPARIKVAWCLDFCRPAVVIKKKKAKKVVLFFMENGKVRDILFGENNNLSFGSELMKGIDHMVLYKEGWNWDDPESDTESKYNPSNLLPASYRLLPVEEKMNELSVSAEEIQQYVVACETGSETFNENVLLRMANGITPKTGVSIELYLFSKRLESGEHVYYDKEDMFVEKEKDVNDNEEEILGSEDARIQREIEDTLRRWNRQKEVPRKPNHFVLRDAAGKVQWWDSWEDHILVSPTRMGAWYMYLMFRNTLLIEKKERNFHFSPILSVKDLMAVVPDREMVVSLVKDELFLPSVVPAQDGKSMDVYCCYGGKGIGLIRDHVRIFMDEEGGVTTETIELFDLLQGPDRNGRQFEV